MHLLAALCQHAQENPARPAFIVYHEDKITTLSRARLWEESARWAARLHAAIGTAGGVIFIVMKHRPELYTAFLGAMRAGLTPSFLPFPSAKQEPERYWRLHREVFHHVHPVAVITSAELAMQMREVLVGLNVSILDVDEINAAPVVVDEAPPPEFLDSVALLQHSSGTTGLKKGVALTFRQIAYQVASYRASLNIGPEDAIASWLPLYHDMGLMTGFLLPVQTGTPVISLDAFAWVSEPISLLDRMAAHNCTLAWLPNFAFAHMARTRPFDWTADLSRVRAFIGCSEPNRLETFSSFAETFAPNGVRLDQLQACYAMAETVFAVSQSLPGAPPRVLQLDSAALSRGEVVPVDDNGPHTLSFISNGALLNGIELRIGTPGDATSEGRPRIGEIHLRGAFVFDGYHRNPQATAAAIEQGWYRTGDVGFLDGDEIFICGRMKEIIIVHGRNYYAGDLEAVVSRIVGVIPGRAVVFGVYNAESASEEAVAVVETDLQDARQRLDLRRTVRRTVLAATGLSLHTVRCEQRGWLLKTSSGKINRGDNVAKFLAALQEEGKADGTH